MSESNEQWTPYLKELRRDVEELRQKLIKIQNEKNNSRESSREKQ